MKADRKNFLGGSDMAAALGMSKYKTPFQLWQEKTGRRIHGEETKQMSRGKKLEPIVRALAIQYFDKINDLTILNNIRVFDEKFPFISGELDGIGTINNCSIVLEYKTASIYTMKNFGEEHTGNIPIEYIIQCQTYLHLVNAEKAFVGVYFIDDDIHLPDLEKMIDSEKMTVDEIAIFIRKNNIGRFKLFFIDRDQVMIDCILEHAQEFWNCVLNDTPPEPIAKQDVIIKIREKNNIGERIATPQEVDIIEHIAMIRDQIKDLQEKMNNMKNHLSLEGTNLISDDGWTFELKISKRDTIDVQKLKEENPEIYNKYKKTTEFLKTDVKKKIIL